METAIALCRMLHFTSALWLFGIAVFQAVLVTPAVLANVDRRLRAIAVAAVWVAAFTAIAWLGLEAGNMGEGWLDTISPSTWWAILSETAFGHVWIVHLALGLVLILLGFDRRAPRWISLLVTALFLGTLGAVGHPAVVPWPATIGNVVHLLAAGFWVGGFIPLLLCLGAAWNDTRLHGEAMMAVLSRFSIGGHVAVAAVLITGVVNVVYVLGRWPTNLSSPYDLLLLAKIALVAAMICFALLNRYLAMPSIEKGNPKGALALRRMTVAELVLSLGVIGLVSVFGMLSPM